MTQSPRPGSQTPARPPLTLLQVLVIIGLVAGLLIMLDFNRRQAEAQRLEADRGVASLVTTRTTRIKRTGFRVGS